MTSKTTVGRLVRMLLAFAAGGILLYLAIRGVDILETWRVVTRMRWAYFCAAVGLVVLSPLVRAWRWGKLFDGEAPEFWSLVRAVVTGQTLNYVIPLRSGEVARVFMVEGRKLQVAGTIALEKFLDAAFFAALCLLLPLVWVMPEWLEKPLLSVMVTAGVYLLIVMILVAVMPKIKSLPQIARVPRMKKLPILLGTSLYLWSSSILVNYFALRALRVQTPFLAAIVVLVILQVGVAVPSTPGKVGVFQYLAVLALSLFGVAKAAALAFGLVLHLIVFLPVAVMATVFWARSRSRPLHELSQTTV